MKRILSIFLITALAVLGAPKDIKLVQRNAGDTAFTEVTLTPENGKVITFDGSLNPVIAAANSTGVAATVSEALTGTDTTKYLSPAAGRAADLLFATKREAAPQVISDGTFTNRAMVHETGDRGDVAGAPILVWAGFVSVPSSAFSTYSGFISCLNDAGRTNDIRDTSRAYTLWLEITTSNALRVKQTGSSSADYRIQALNGFRSTYSGQVVFLEVQITAGTGDIVVKVNNVDVSANLSAQQTGGTPPPWLDSSLNVSYQSNAYNWTAGDTPLGCWINAALTDADRTYWLTHGVPPEWVLRGGSMVSLNTNAAVNGSSPFDTFSGASTTGVTFADSTANARRLSWQIATSNLRVGDIIRIRFDYVRNSGSAQMALQARASADGGIVTVITSDLGSTGTRNLSFVWTGSGAFLTVNKANNGDNSFDGSISNLRVYVEGALGFPVVGPDRFVRDGTRISPPIDGYMVGMRPLSTDADGWIRGRRTSSGYLQADTQLVGDGRGVVQVLMRSVSGGTVTLGESAGSPATVVASVSLTAGVWTPCTILKSVVSGGKLYADLGTATDVEVAVRTGPILSLVISLPAFEAGEVLRLYANRWTEELPLAV